MLKKISYFIFYLLYLLDRMVLIFFKRSYLIFFKDFFEKKSYQEVKISGKKLKFFVPNELTQWRVRTFYEKEPETLEWIDSFDNKDNKIFWDIGANIGLYSIYNAVKNQNISSVSFEPSTSNLRVLSRNISINNLQDKIKIFPISLTDKENSFLKLREGGFVEGGALNTFGEDYNFEGKKFENKMSYKVFGTTIQFLLKNEILEIPDYIKIDVDGIEHLILYGAKEFLNNRKIKSLSVEINENFKNHYKNIVKIMADAEFKILQKKRSKAFIVKGSKFENTYNYIFIR